MIAKTAIIYPNVVLGKDCEIQDYCIIGAPAAGTTDAETRIGDRAVIRSFTVIYSGNQIGDNFQTGNKANIRELNHIGNNVSIGTLSVVEHHVIIEDDVRIHTQAFVPEFCTLRRGAWIGPNTVLTNAKFPRSPGVKDTLRGVIVEEGAVVGANATLLAGVTIGKRALVGAGSVVVGDIGSAQIVVGNPAKSIGTRRY